MSDRYVVVAGNATATVELAERGAHATITIQDKRVQVEGHRTGAVAWRAMVDAGVNPQSVHTFAVCEDEPNGTSVAYLHAVLEGARIVWLILYRADRSASAFRPLGSRQRIGDALEACFQQVIEDIKLPHKP